MELHDMRKEFGSQLDYELNLPKNPFEAFKQWFEEAEKLYKEEANCFVLSTVNRLGKVNSRILLLKNFNNKNLTFFTNYKSQKAKEIDENPQVSCLFYWSSMEKQIRISGTAKKSPQETSKKYFSMRPRNSQIAAWASKQSKEIKSKKNLIETYISYKKDYSKKEKIPYPDFWGGYDIIPKSFEFWQGGLYRLHDRIKYKLEKNSQWKQTRLSP